MVQLFFWLTTTLANGSVATVPFDDGEWAPATQFETMVQCQQEKARVESLDTNDFGIMVCGYNEPAWEPHTADYLNSLKAARQVGGSPAR